MSELEAAWLAGLIDGEGAIWCRWPKRTNVVVEVKMAHKQTIERIQSLFPGRMAPGHLSKNGLSKLPQWRWSVDTLKAGELLQRIAPYLVTKRAQAEAAIHLCRRPIDRDHMNRWMIALKEAGKPGPLR